MPHFRRPMHRLMLALLAVAACSAAQALEFLRADFSQGGVAIGKTAPDAQVKLDGKAVRVSPEGHFVIGFGRDHGASAQLLIAHADGPQEQRSLEIAPRDYAIQRIDGLPPSKVTPRSEADLKRIRDDIRQVKAARAADDPRTDFVTEWIWPVTGIITGVYGSQRVLNGEPRRPHYGIDIAAPTGTPVKAPADGVVTLTHPDMFFSGGTLILDHGHRLSSTFLHLDEILVEEGQRVRQGESIATVGATGRVTGAHLDWRMNCGSARVDPGLLVPPMKTPE